MQVDTQAAPSFAFATITVAPGAEVQVEAGAMAACSDGVEVDTKWGGAESFFGGEGVVTRFTGPGRLWLQTRSPQDLLGWLIPKLPSDRN